MQSTPTLKDTDPHDVFAIESLLAAHAVKAPPLAHEPAASPVAPQVQVAAKPQVQVAPPISVGAPNLQVEPPFPASDALDIPIENIRPGEINVSGLKLPGERPTAKWVKRVVLALLGLCGALAAAAWQHYGDQATAMAAEWAPPFVLAALPSSAKPAMAEQPSAPTAETSASNQAAVQQPEAVATQPEPATTAAAATPAAESTQLQSMARDLATMGQQVEELKTTIAQLRASQAQMTREFAKVSEAKASQVTASQVTASEAKSAEIKPAEQNPRPRVSALTPPRPAAPPPVRKPKPVSSYSPAPLAAAPLQATAPLPPAPPQQTLADDGAPVVRPPMPLR